MTKITLPEDMIDIIRKMDERLQRAEKAISRPDDGGIIQGGLNAVAYRDDIQGDPFWWEIISNLYQWDMVIPDALNDAEITNDFVLILQGFIRFKYAETYTIYCYHADGTMIRVGGTTVVDQWNDSADQYEMHSGTVPISDPPTVLRPIQIDHYKDSPGGQSLVLYWESPSQEIEIIPQDALFFETPRWEPVGLPKEAGGCGSVWVDGNNQDRDRLILHRKLLTGRVQFRGESSGGGGITVLKMPPGWRTQVNPLRWPTTSNNNVFGEVRALPSGNIDIDGTGSGNRSLDVVNYYAYDEYGATDIE